MNLRRAFLRQILRTIDMEMSSLKYQATRQNMKQGAMI